MKVHEALSKVMADVGAVKKSGHNSQSNYNFRGIDAVTSAVYPALVKHGVVVAPKVLDYQYGTVTVGRNRTEMGHARLTVQFTFHGPEGDQLIAVTAGEAFDSGDKATAKAHSVALRTALLQTLCLPTDEPDPDAHTYERATRDIQDDPGFAAARTELAAEAAKRGYTREGMEDKCIEAVGLPVTAEKIRKFIKELDAVKEPAEATA